MIDLDTIPEEETLLTSDVSREMEGQQFPKTLTWSQLLKAPVLRPLTIACLGMLAQQLSGMLSSQSKILRQ
jgi:hypothetical protein